MPTRLKVRYALITLCGALSAFLYAKLHDGTWQSYSMTFIASTGVGVFLVVAITRATQAR